jgi:fluoride exporter
MLPPWLAVALGGALGSVARHGVNVAVARALGHASYASTLLVNISGCAVIGVLAGQLAVGRLAMSPTLRAFVFVGILGGFTTFSTFGLDTLTLFRDGRHGAAALNAAAQVVVGLLAVAGGYAVGQRL